MPSRKRRPSLLGGLLWTGLGILFLLRSFGTGPDIWSMVARYWPILLILLGLGKVIDYFRQKEGVSLRFGEVFGILFILIIGSAISRISESTVGDFLWDVPIRIGGSEVTLENSYAYSEENSYSLTPDVPLRIENDRGDVSVSPGSDREVRVRLRKVVYNDDEAQAKEISGRIALKGEAEATEEDSVFVLTTNREELASENYRFNTDMEVFVPKNCVLQIRNSYGEVKVADLEGKLDVWTTQELVEVSSFTGELFVSNRYGESRLSNLSGSVTVEARGRVEIESVRGDVDIRNEYSPVTVTDVEGKVNVANTESRITIARVSQPVTIEAKGSQVEVDDLKSSLTVSTSHRRLEISGVEADVKLACRYANGTLKNIKGDVDIESNSDRFNLEDIGGHLVVRAVGSSVRANGIEGRVEIATTLKDVMVNNFSAGCRVANEYADVTLSTGRLGSDAVTVSNRNGDIDLYLPEDAAFEIDATARNGRVVSEIEGLEPASATGNAGILKGALGTGGPKITLETEYSNIDIRPVRSRSVRNR